MSATEESDWDSVVWIDDVLGTDARKWATEHDQQVHLEQPDPDNGLTEGHVARIEAFVANIPSKPLYRDVSSFAV